MTYSNILTIRETAKRCKAEGIPLPENAIRRFVKDGSLPAMKSGTKSLIYFPNVVDFIKFGNVIPQAEPESGTIRRIAE